MIPFDTYSKILESDKSEELEILSRRAELSQKGIYRMQDTIIDMEITDPYFYTSSMCNQNYTFADGEISDAKITRPLAYASLGLLSSVITLQATHSPKMAAAALIGTMIVGYANTKFNLMGKQFEKIDQRSIEKKYDQKIAEYDLYKNLLKTQEEFKNAQTPQLRRMAMIEVRAAKRAIKSRAQTYKKTKGFLVSHADKKEILNTYTHTIPFERCYA